MEKVKGGNFFGRKKKLKANPAENRENHVFWPTFTSDPLFYQDFPSIDKKAKSEIYKKKKLFQRELPKLSLFGQKKEIAITVF